MTRATIIKVELIVIVSFSPFGFEGSLVGVEVVTERYTSGGSRGLSNSAVKEARANAGSNP